MSRCSIPQLLRAARSGRREQSPSSLDSWFQRLSTDRDAGSRGLERRQECVTSDVRKQFVCRLQAISLPAGFSVRPRPAASRLGTAAQSFLVGAAGKTVGLHGGLTDTTGKVCASAMVAREFACADRQRAQPKQPHTTSRLHRRLAAQSTTRLSTNDNRGLGIARVVGTCSQFEAAVRERSAAALRGPHLRQRRYAGLRLPLPLPFPSRRPRSTTFCVSVSRSCAS